MKGEDFAGGIYWILHAVDYKLGGGYDFSTGIDYKNDVFETFAFWSHCDCTCPYETWQWDISKKVDAIMDTKYPDVEERDSEFWRLYQMETENVTQGIDPGHDPDCKLESVGFRHFESGLEVEWYKRVGRSTKSNKNMKTLDWFRIVVQCLESVRDDGRDPDK